MKTLLAPLAFAFAAILNTAEAAKIAVFGDNDIGQFLSSSSGGGHEVELVGNTQLETSGYLSSNGFDLFVYTRDGNSFSTDMSATAAMNVRTFVTGNVVLFTSDLQDDKLPAGGTTAKLLTNAVNFASNKGFIGELVGACAAMTSNNAGFNPVGLVVGDCDFGPPAFNYDPDADPLNILEPEHPVVAGVTQLNLKESFEFFAKLDMRDPRFLTIAESDTGTPAIVASPATPIQPVPEPGSLSLLVLAIAAFAVLRRTSAYQKLQAAR